MSTDAHPKPNVTGRRWPCEVRVQRRSARIHERQALSTARGPLARSGQPRLVAAWSELTIHWRQGENAEMRPPTAHRTRRRRQARESPADFRVTREVTRIVRGLIVVEDRDGKRCRPTLCKTGENGRLLRRESYTQNDSAELTLGNVSWIEGKGRSECHVDRAGNGEVVLAGVSRSVAS